MTNVRDVNNLVAMAHVADIEASIRFYGLLGFTANPPLRGADGRAYWAWLRAGQASLMVALASEPVVASKQAVLFYLYTDDLVALRAHLSASGIAVSAITYPDYMEKGECRVSDPDGYVLLIGQAG